MTVPLIVPAFVGLSDTLAPWTEAMLRIVVGLALVPHGLRMTFGLFAGPNIKVRNLKDHLAAQLDGDGYRPGNLWAPRDLGHRASSLAHCWPPRPVHPHRRVTNRDLSHGGVLGTLAQGRLVLEHPGPGIHPDVDDRGGVFPGPRRRNVFAGLLAAGSQFLGGGFVSRARCSVTPAERSESRGTVHRRPGTALRFRVYGNRHLRRVYG